MRLAVSVPTAGVSPTASVELARWCSSHGFAAAWGSEVAGPDFASTLGAVALAAPNLELGVAVIPVQTRTPWLIAATAATLSDLTGGRFTLGLGTSSEVIVEQWSGIPFERPLARLRETTEVVRAMLAGERLQHDGEHVRTHGYRLPVTPPAPVRIVLGALGPASLRQAGAIGDGVCLNQLGPEHVGGVLDQVRAGAAEAGRTLDDSFEVVARLFCWVTDDVAAARDVVRRAFAPYAATRVYNAFFRGLGFAEEMDAVAAAASAGDRAAMSAALSDRFVDSCYVLGDADAVAGRVSAYVDAGVTVPVIACLGPGPDEAQRTLGAIGERLGS